jgi:hypothetical protein
MKGISIKIKWLTAAMDGLVIANEELAFQNWPSR